MMNYSDYDSDGYSSNEDADYVPSDDNLSEDDINECEKEDPLHEDDTVPHSEPISKKKKKKDISVRKRKKRLLKVDDKDEDVGGAKEADNPQEEVKTPTKAKDQDDEAKQKKKSDELWASFLSDVGSRPKESAPQSGTTQKDDSTVSKTASAVTETKPSGPAKVTITKVFDFAGEEVWVNKEVSADSREAKSYLKSQSVNEDEKSENEKTSSPCSPPLPGSSTKRPAGMSNVLSRIGGKKQKMSTLEKSKMDWDAFKSEEGITEELAIHNRGREGYVERKNFLERVDHRQFELEKAVRLSNMKQ
ncbi:craniofacial development protein 1 [Oreochromis aureus]|uniref:Craniofacial development protein 1 n=1 Tax=Oreochromis aureus TaxID=47969 RepID=A0A668T6U8_OREAU|nr:craniofacial development protein 1 [Oreochromis aureus]